MMEAADTPRQGDLDGRGNLSERALVEFMAWFLRVAIDRVSFILEARDADQPQTLQVDFQTLAAAGTPAVFSLEYREAVCGGLR